VNGDPGTCAKAPFVAMSYTATLLEMKSATNRRVPALLMAMPVGRTPRLAFAVGNGDPGMGVSAPLTPIVNAETLLETELVAYSRPAVTTTSTASMLRLADPAPPVSNGDPGTGVRAPVTVLTANPVMVFVVLTLLLT
jgi:hypothetical protein